MRIKSKPLTQEQVAALNTLLARKENHVLPPGGKVNGVFHIAGFIAETSDLPAGTREVDLVFEDQRGVDISYFREVVTFIGALSRFVIAKDGEGEDRVQTVVFRGAGTVHRIDDGTTYEMETDSTTRWGIKVTGMPRRRFCELIPLIDTVMPSGAPYGQMTSLEVVNGALPMRFSFTLNVRHCSMDDAKRLQLGEVLGVPLEWAKETAGV